MAEGTEALQKSLLDYFKYTSTMIKHIEIESAFGVPLILICLKSPNANGQGLFSLERHPKLCAKTNEAGSHTQGSAILEVSQHSCLD